MDQITVPLCVVLFLAYLIWTHRHCQRFIFDWKVNLQQAKLDALRSTEIYNDITRGTEEYDRRESDRRSHRRVTPERRETQAEINLPFLDLPKCPTSWWYAVWEYDFLATTVVMQHLVRNSQPMTANPQ